MHQILVIRFSQTRGSFNQKLREALAGTFDPSCTPAFPMPMGGMISVLITEHTFDEIVKIVQDADCGENVIVIDSADQKSQVIKASSASASIESMDEEVIRAEIQRLIEKKDSGDFSQADAERLTRLLTSEPM